jgi:hypothetical protein
MKTAEELSDLKMQWESDPCWDIEKTKGFEYHYSELKAYRERREEAWRLRYEAEIQKWKRVTGSVLDAKIEALENRVKSLENELDRLTARIAWRA